MAGSLRIAARKAADQLRAGSVGMITAAYADVVVPEGVRPLFQTSSFLDLPDRIVAALGSEYCWRRPRPVPSAETINTMDAAGIFRLEAI